MHSIVDFVGWISEVSVTTFSFVEVCPVYGEVAIIIMAALSIAAHKSQCCSFFWLAVEHAMQCLPNQQVWHYVVVRFNKDKLSGFHVTVMYCTACIGVFENWMCIQSTTVWNVFCVSLCLVNLLFFLLFILLLFIYLRL